MCSRELKNNSPYHLRKCSLCEGKAELVAVKPPILPLRKRRDVQIMCGCTDCGVHTRLYDVVEDAVDAWNRQVVHT